MEPHRWSAEPIASRMSLCRARGGLKVVPGGSGAARGGSRLLERNPRETPAALASVCDGSVPRACLLWAAALLLEVIADDAPGDGEASVPPPPGGPAWPGGPLTASETRVLRYRPVSEPELYG